MEIGDKYASKSKRGDRNDQKGKGGKYRINNDIPNRGTCMLIDEDGTQLGEFTVGDAKAEARERKLDLVEISPNVNPPVCRLMDWGRYMYQQQKRARDAQRSSKAQQLKEMKFRCGIGDGDYETKKKHVERFLRGGSKVRITIMFRGREVSHPDLGIEILDRLAQDLSDMCTVISAPKLDGRNMLMTVAPLDEIIEKPEKSGKAEKA